MKLSKLLSGVSLIKKPEFDPEITDVCYDSRKVTPGSLFVCIKGFVTDGHLYIESAIKNGASAILVQDATDLPGVTVLRSEDTRKALAQISANFYEHPEKQLSIIGITGTNGKTTVSNLIKNILESAGKTVGLIGTNGNMIGSRLLSTERTTPESLELFALFRQMVDEGTQYVVMEVSSHSLFLHRVFGIPFSVGVFTNLTQDHLDFHETMENYYLAKRMLFSMCKTGVVNVDDPAGQRIVSEVSCPLISYAIDNNAGFAAKDVTISPRGIHFQLTSKEATLPATLKIPGKFSAYNAMAAFCACKALGFTSDIILSALAKAPGVQGRAETLDTDTDYTMIIDYAHTPDGLENILKTVREFCKGRLITLFGCGGDRDPIKRPIMGEIAGQLSDYCVITSDNPRTEDPMSIIRQIEEGMKRTDCEYTVIESRRDAIRYAMQFATAEDCIVLAGTGHETYQIIGKEKRHFDEREVVSEILAEKTK